ncbi:MAG: site-specific DNA-methyltransferase [Planctomycetes bacterium]|nr:site-specific DNA-methyltransferase [Planctomycetota bacterium]
MAATFEDNLLCYGDNLVFLKEFPDESVDLIYLDPPFNSQQSYNVLFKEATGAPEAAQIRAFEDTWTWDLAANEALTQIQRDPAVPAPLAELTRTFMGFLKPSPMMAYLVQMAVRLVQMHRVLRPTGSLYLHCDPTAGHYLKLILDAVFGPRNFLNEITWERFNFHADAKRWGRLHDVLLVYAKQAGHHTYNTRRKPYDQAYIDSHFKKDASGRLFRLDNALAAGQGPPRVFFGKRLRPKPGTHWRWSQEKINQLIAQGRIVLTRKGWPAVIRYLDEMPGHSVGDVWTDIPEINSQAAERLGYPTQKPVELLKRVVSASSNPGDMVLDPFCGCGTTIDAVETLNRENPHAPPRRWIGIDITHVAIGLVKHRLGTRFKPLPEFREQGVPVSAAGAAAIAARDPFDFQYWALGQVGARPMWGKPRKGADRGIDGVRYFQDEQKNGAWLTKKMLVQVKSGHVKPGDVRDLAGTREREGAELAVFLTLEPPSKPMRTEAAAAGSYVSPWDGRPYPKVQVLTIEEVLKDPQRPNPRCLQVPGGAGGLGITLPEAPRHRPRRVRQDDMDFGNPKKE